MSKKEKKVYQGTYVTLAINDQKYVDRETGVATPTEEGVIESMNWVNFKEQ